MRNAQKILAGLSHWRLQANEGKSFELYLISRPTSASYAHWLGAPRFIRREVIGERIGYAFLIMNCTTWLLDKYVRPTIYGAPKKEKKEAAAK